MKQSKKTHKCLFSADLFVLYDAELLADLMKDKPLVETGYDNIIVVDNAPKVGPDRMVKLQSVLNKVFGRFGNIVSQDYPVDEDGVFKG